MELRKQAILTLLGVMLIKISTGVLALWGSLNLYILSYFHHIGTHITPLTNSLIILAIIIPTSLIILAATKISNRFGYQRTIRVCALIFFLAPQLINLKFNLVIFSFACVLVPASMFAVSSIPVINCLWTQFPEVKHKATAIAVFCYGLGSIIWNFLFTIKVNPNNSSATIMNEADMMFFGEGVVQNVFGSVRNGYLLCGSFFVVGSWLIKRNQEYKQVEFEEYVIQKMGQKEPLNKLGITQLQIPDPKALLLNLRSSISLLRKGSGEALQKNRDSEEKADSFRKSLQLYQSPRKEREIVRRSEQYHGNKGTTDIAFDDQKRKDQKQENILDSLGKQKEELKINLLQKEEKKDSLVNFRDSFQSFRQEKQPKKDQNAKKQEKIGFQNVLFSRKFIYIFLISLFSGIYQIYIHLNIKIIYMPIVNNDYFLVFCAIISYTVAIFGAFFWGYLGDKKGIYISLLIFTTIDLLIKIYGCFAQSQTTILIMFILLGLSDKGMMTMMGPGLVEMFGLEMGTELLPYKAISIFLGFVTVPALYIMMSFFLSSLQFLVFLLLFSIICVILAYKLFYL